MKKTLPDFPELFILLRKLCLKRKNFCLWCKYFFVKDKNF